MLFLSSLFHLLNQCLVDVKQPHLFLSLTLLSIWNNFPVSAIHQNSKYCSVQSSIQESLIWDREFFILYHSESTRVCVLQANITYIYVSQNYLPLLFMAPFIAFLMVIHSQTINFWSLLAFFSFFFSPTEWLILFHLFSAEVCFSYCLSDVTDFSSLVLGHIDIIKNLNFWGQS